MIRAFLNSFGYAVQGLVALWKKEKSFRLEIVLSALVVVAMLVLRFTYLEALMLVFAMLLVIGAEILNTIIERMLDLIEPNHHPTVGTLKDMMAAAVLCSSLAAFVIALFTVLHHYGF